MLVSADVVRSVFDLRGSMMGADCVMERERERERRLGLGLFWVGCARVGEYDCQMGIWLANMALGWICEGLG